jgi:hypothetical protein
MVIAPFLPCVGVEHVGLGPTRLRGIMPLAVKSQATVFRNYLAIVYKIFTALEFRLPNSI